MLPKFLTIGLLLFQIGIAAAIDSSRIRKDIEFLASDELKGRLSGTPEGRKAAEYIASEFRKAGLEFVPRSDSPFQPFEFTSGIKIGPHNQLVANGDSYLPQTDFVPVGFSEDGKVTTASVVFAGYGIRSAELKHDDYTGLNVQGKIVLCYRFGPGGNDPKSRYSRFYPIRYKAMMAREMGASALLVVAENEKEDQLIPFRRDTSFGTSGIPVFSIKQRVAQQWFQSSGRKWPAGSQSSRSFELPGIKISLTSEVIREKSTADNVLGWIPARTGTQETLVIGAHYDHLGLGIQGSLSPKWGVVHNGADDNASGVAGLLELARFFGTRKNVIKRNILFIAFGGEEMGVLGSSHFLKNSPVKIENIIAMLNMDMIGRLRDQKLIVGGTGTAREWKPILNGLNRHRLKLTFQEDGYGPSDHAVFYGKKIPVLFFFTGAHSEYHKPEDDADRISYDGMVAVVDYISRIGQRILEMPLRPFFTPVKTQNPRTAGRGLRLYLGTIPDYAEELKGVRLSGVQAGSPAEKAGIQADDVIVEFGGKEVRSVYDYTHALQQHHPGDVVTVVVLRESKRISLKVTLQAR
jgi:aminopeptidase YwaD